MGPTLGLSGPMGRGMMRLESPAFGSGEWIPRRHTGEGQDISPPLHWDDVPPATRSFVLILDDPDAPPGLWIHWVLYDIPGDVRELGSGLPRTSLLENGALQGVCWGVDAFSRQGYQGPMPPPGSPHRYTFTLYALDTELNLPPGRSAEQVRAVIKGHVLAEAVLTGVYGRSGSL
jgi:Raf kinase inhibitor-like YbhB/YbcL family protein